jgi:hypothetical protein
MTIASALREKSPATAAAHTQVTMQAASNAGGRCANGASTGRGRGEPKPEYGAAPGAAGVDPSAGGQTGGGIDGTPPCSPVRGASCEPGDGGPGGGVLTGLRGAGCRTGRPANQSRAGPVHSSTALTATSAEVNGPPGMNPDTNSGIAATDKPMRALLLRWRT